MRLTEYKVDWVRSRTASRKRTHRMDLRIAPEVHHNVDVMPFVVDHPHIRVSGAGRRTKVLDEGTRGPQTMAMGIS